MATRKVRKADSATTNGHVASSASFFAASCSVTGFARSSFPSSVFLEMPRLCSTPTASGSFLNDSRSAHWERDCTRAGNAALTADSEILAVAYSSSSRMTCWAGMSASNIFDATCATALWRSAVEPTEDIVADVPMQRRLSAFSCARIRLTSMATSAPWRPR